MRATMQMTMTTTTHDVTAWALRRLYQVSPKVKFVRNTRTFQAIFSFFFWKSQVLRSADNVNPTNTQRVKTVSRNT